MLALRNEGWHVTVPDSLWPAFAGRRSTSRARFSHHPPATGPEVWLDIWTPARGDTPATWTWETPVNVPVPLLVGDIRLPDGMGFRIERDS